jgi:hypothetical protein
VCVVTHLESSLVVLLVTEPLLCTLLPLLEDRSSDEPRLDLPPLPLLLRLEEPTDSASFSGSSTNVAVD